MTERPEKSLLLAMAIVLAWSAFSENSTAQGFRDQNPQVSSEIGLSVYKLAQLADEMAFKYEWELRLNAGCKDSLALLKCLQNHVNLTNDLVRAYRGKCGQSFQKISCEVRDSVTCIQNLSKRSRVSSVVSRMIDQAGLQATFVQTHSNYFQQTAKRNTFGIARRG